MRRTSLYILIGASLLAGGAFGSEGHTIQRDWFDYALMAVGMLLVGINCARADHALEETDRQRSRAEKVASWRNG